MFLYLIAFLCVTSFIESTKSHDKEIRLATEFIMIDANSKLDSLLNSTSSKIASKYELTLSEKNQAQEELQPIKDEFLTLYKPEIVKILNDPSIWNQDSSESTESTDKKKAKIFQKRSVPTQDGRIKRALNKVASALSIVWENTFQRLFTFIKQVIDGIKRRFATRQKPTHESESPPSTKGKENSKNKFNSFRPSKDKNAVDTKSDKNSKVHANAKEKTFTVKGIITDELIGRIKSKFKPTKGSESPLKENGKSSTPIHELKNTPIHDSKNTASKEKPNGSVKGDTKSLSTFAPIIDTENTDKASVANHDKSTVKETTIIRKLQTDTEKLSQVHLLDQQEHSKLLQNMETKLDKYTRTFEQVYYYPEVLEFQNVNGIKSQLDKISAKLVVISKQVKENSMILKEIFENSKNPKDLDIYMEAVVDVLERTTRLSGRVRLLKSVFKNHGIETVEEIQNQLKDYESMAELLMKVKRSPQEATVAEMDAFIESSRSIQASISTRRSSDVHRHGNEILGITLENDKEFKSLSKILAKWKTDREITLSKPIIVRSNYETVLKNIQDTLDQYIKNLENMDSNSKELKGKLVNEIREYTDAAHKVMTHFSVELLHDSISHPRVQNYIFENDEKLDKLRTALARPKKYINTHHVGQLHL